MSASVWVVLWTQRQCQSGSQAIGRLLRSPGWWLELPHWQDLESPRRQWGIIYIRWVNEGGEEPPWTWVGPGMHTKIKANRAPLFIFLCFLNLGTKRPAASCIYCHDFPPENCLSCDRNSAHNECKPRVWIHVIHLWNFHLFHGKQCTEPQEIWHTGKVWNIVSISWRLLSNVHMNFSEIHEKQD